MGLLILKVIEMVKWHPIVVIIINVTLKTYDYNCTLKEFGGNLLTNTLCIFQWNEVIKHIVYLHKFVCIFYFLIILFTVNGKTGR